MRTRLVAGSLFVFVAVSASWAQTPLGTAFTYQGQLNQAGQPFNGPADLLFDLYDASSAGNLVGTQTLNGVPVSAGLFTVQLNGGGEFGASAFTGEQRWLEISVNGTPLSPRQALTAAPNALFALNADQLDGLDSTAFLQSIPIPLTLIGTSNNWMIKAENATTAAGAASIHGAATGATGNTYAGYFQSASTSGTGVLGISNALSGTTYGLRGQSSSPDGRGVYGTAIATTGDTYGVWGRSASTSGRGVFGEASATSGLTFGVFGQSSSSNNGRGVYGLTTTATGTAYGVYGESASTSGIGVYGIATDQNGTNYGGRFHSDGLGAGVYGTGNRGVMGETDSTSGRALYGNSTATTFINYGVYGQSASVQGRGVFGRATATTGENYGGEFSSASTSGYGVYAEVTATTGLTYAGRFQCSSNAGIGVYGDATSGSGSTTGVYGRSDGSTGRGVFGEATATNGTNYGGRFESDSSFGRGVYGAALVGGGTPYGVLGAASTQSAGYAVYASGDLGASGTKSFRIDHPFDPENKYLLHYATESPSPQNFYSGNLVTDGTGYAWVELPEYFEEINEDYKYQLTVIGRDFAQAIVSQEILGNRFQIRTSAPGVKVSWRVEANRNDLYVRYKKPKDVVEKEGLERGTYQHPELYGQPPEMGMNYDAERERRSDDRPSLATAPDTTRQK